MEPIKKRHPFKTPDLTHMRHPKPLLHLPRTPTPNPPQSKRTQGSTVPKWSNHSNTSNTSPGYPPFKSHPRPVHPSTRIASTQPLPPSKTKQQANPICVKSPLDHLPEPTPEQKEAMNKKHVDILVKRVLEASTKKTSNYNPLTHIQSLLDTHIDLDNTLIHPKTSIGERVLKNGKVLIKIIEAYVSTKRGDVKTLVENVVRRNVRRVNVFATELNDCVQRMIEAYGYDSGQSSDSSPEIRRYDSNGDLVEEKAIRQVEEKTGCQNISHVVNKPCIPEPQVEKGEIRKHDSLQASASQSPGKLYPTFDDYPPLSVPQLNPLDPLCSAPAPTPTPTPTPTPSQTPLLRDPQYLIKQTLCLLFWSFEIFNLQDLQLVGVVQNDYLNKGQFAIILAKRKSPPVSDQFFCLFPLQKNPLQDPPCETNLLSQIKQKFFKKSEFIGWIRNPKLIDIFSYWSLEYLQSFSE